MSQERQPDQLNRREMLKWLGKRGLETGVFFAGVNVAFAIRDISQNSQTEKAYAQDTQAIESGYATQVKYFAGDILNTSQEIIGYQPDQNIIELLVGFFGGNTLIGYILKNRSSLINRAVGSISVVPARLLDSLSTIAATKYIQDPRFQEYGFGDYIAERNGVFPDAISSEDVFNLNLISNPILLAGGWIAPPLGRGYLGASTLVAKNNFQFASSIAKSLELGDGVKALLKDGKTPQDVSVFLQQELSKVREISQKTIAKSK